MLPLLTFFLSKGFRRIGASGLRFPGPGSAESWRRRNGAGDLECPLKSENSFAANCLSASCFAGRKGHQIQLTQIQFGYFLRGQNPVVTIGFRDAVATGEDESREELRIEFRQCICTRGN